MAKRLQVKRNPDYDWLDETPTYQDIVETFGEILVEEESGSYQGDSLYLIRGEDLRYGVLTFGWGSCSGCDALQDCRSQEDINTLQDDLERGIKWFYCLDEVKDYLVDGGLKDSYLDSSLVLNFGTKVIELEKKENN